MVSIFQFPFQEISVYPKLMKILHGNFRNFCFVLPSAFVYTINVKLMCVCVYCVEESKIPVEPPPLLKRHSFSYCTEFSALFFINPKYLYGCVYIQFLFCSSHNLFLHKNHAQFFLVLFAFLNSSLDFKFFEGCFVSVITRLFENVDLNLNKLQFGQTVVEAREEVFRFRRVLMRNCTCWVFFLWRFILYFLS